MGVLKAIGYFIASLIVLSVVLGGGIVVAVVGTFIGIVSSVMFLICFVAYSIKNYFES